MKSLERFTDGWIMLWSMTDCQMGSIIALWIIPVLLAQRSSKKRMSLRQARSHGELSCKTLHYSPLWKQVTFQRMSLTVFSCRRQQASSREDFCHMPGQMSNICSKSQEITWFLKETALSIFPKMFKNSVSISAETFPTKLPSMEHFSPDSF